LGVTDWASGNRIEALRQADPTQGGWIGDTPDSFRIGWIRECRAP